MSEVKKWFQHYLPHCPVMKSNIPVFLWFQKVLQCGDTNMFIAWGQKCKLYHLSWQNTANDYFSSVVNTWTYCYTPTLTLVSLHVGIMKITTDTNSASRALEDFYKPNDGCFLNHGSCITYEIQNSKASWRNYPLQNKNNS